MREVRNMRYAAARFACGTYPSRGVASFPLYSTSYPTTFPTLLEHLDYMVLIGIDTEITRDAKRLLDDFQRRHIGILQKRARGRVSIRAAASNRGNPEFGFNHIA